MSRRPPNAAAERAAKNQATIMSLLKLEPNKMCADCKRNKHPRWASWNLGVFICIRCSGIHRSMGVHISRVKSVDLDSWTDEQMQSILSWGNARANKYWESKLAAGHVPSEAKIENFIRTKYELKRWAMNGPIPDPASLDADADADVPLSLVKEKQTIEREESIRKASHGQTSALAQVDLIGGDDAIPRASDLGPVAGKPPTPREEPAPTKTTGANSSLLGLDFLGTVPSPPPRPASSTVTAAGMGGSSRPDLKQSILSLYATAPRAQVQPHPAQAHPNSFGSLNSPTDAPSQMTPQPAQSSLSGINDAFRNLGFGKNSCSNIPQTDATAGFGNVSSNKSPPMQQSSAFSVLNSGSFFNSMPAATPSPNPASTTSGGFGDFTSSAAPAQSAARASSAMNDLFDFSSSSAPASAAPASANANSVFNLTQAKSSPAPAATTTAHAIFSISGVSGSDVWGGNAWADPPKALTSEPAQTSNMHGWASGSLASAQVVPSTSGGRVTTPRARADEEFGGWTSSSDAAGGSTGTLGKNFGAGEDLFSNVWK